jgi:hypothetical protein
MKSLVHIRVPYMVAAARGTCAVVNIYNAAELPAQRSREATRAAWRRRWLALAIIVGAAGFELHASAMEDSRHGAAAGSQCKAAFIIPIAAHIG